MKLKKALIATTIALTLAIPATAFAATSTSSAAIKVRGLFGIDSNKLTTEQQADVKDYAQKMADLQKSLLEKMVSNGSMTQAQADAQKSEIDSDLAKGEIFVGGGHGHGGMRGGIDTSKLTDDQKNTLLSLEKEQLALQKDLAGVLVEQNLITQVQADAIKAKVDASMADLTTATVSDRFMMKGEMEGLRLLQGVTLTDTQKTALTGWAEKSAAVQKKIVTLYKDAGVITQAQADTMNSRIDTNTSNPLSFGKMGDGKTGGGHRGRK